MWECNLRWKSKRKIVRNENEEVGDIRENRRDLRGRSACLVLMYIALKAQTGFSQRAIHFP
jgi:hypothetical protein